MQWGQGWWSRDQLERSSEENGDLVLDSGICNRETKNSWDQVNGSLTIIFTTKVLGRGRKINEFHWGHAEAKGW